MFRVTSTNPPTAPPTAMPIMATSIVGCILVPGSIVPLPLPRPLPTAGSGVADVAAVSEVVTRVGMGARGEGGGGAGEEGGGAGGDGCGEAGGITGGLEAARTWEVAPCKDSVVVVGSINRLDSIVGMSIATWELSGRMFTLVGSGCCVPSGVMELVCALVRAGRVLTAAVRRRAASM